MRAPFDRIIVIFNPQSSGDGPRLAEELGTDLARRLPEVPVCLCPTERAGHARDLAREHGVHARTQYAHSYIGLGLTPVMAIGLEKGGKGSLKEIVSVIRTFARFRPFTIQLEDGTRRSFDSLLFANIAEMAKYATLSEAGPPNDGRFEVIALPHIAKWRILGVAFRAATRGLGPQPSVEHYVFTTLKPIPLQLDGELLALDPGTPVCIDIAPAALATLG